MGQSGGTAIRKNTQLS